MKTNSLLGLGRFMIPVPAIIGQRTLLGKARKERARLASIRSEAHHLVHDFVTREMINSLHRGQLALCRYCHKVAIYWKPTLEI